LKQIEKQQKRIRKVRLGKSIRVKSKLQAKKQTDTSCVEPSLQMFRERQVLRVWQDAGVSGEVLIPESLLVFPLLVDNVVVHEHSV